MSFSLSAPMNIIKPNKLREIDLHPPIKYLLQKISPVSADIRDSFQIQKNFLAVMEVTFTDFVQDLYGFGIDVSIHLNRNRFLVENRLFYINHSLLPADLPILHA
jgi:hypothetical protein